MRSLWAAATIGFLSAVAPPALGADAPGPLSRHEATEPPAAVPDFAFVDADGRTRSLEDFEGRAVLLNLWATWCAPCVRELPALDRLQAEVGGEEVEVVALSLDRGGREAVEPFFAKHGIEHLGMYLDPEGDAMRTLRPRGLPTTLLIDAEGREVGRVVGDADWDSEEARELVRRLRAGE